MVDKDKMRLIHELRQQGIEWEVIHDTIGSADVDRKAYYGYQMGLEDSSEQDLVKHAKTLQAIRLSRKVLTAERSINNDQIRDLAAKQLFDKQIQDAIIKDRRDVKLKVKTVTQREIESQEANLFTISDYHYDGDVEQLNKDFALIRDRIIREIKINKLTHIYLAEMGDLVDGAALRVSQLRKIKAGIVTQIIEVSRAYVQLIEELLKYVSITFLILESSNHTQLRSFGTKQNELADEDVMRVFVEYMQVSFKNQKGISIISGEDLMLKILNFNMFFGHGHLIRGKSGYLERLQSDRNVIIDYGFFGHFHHCRDIDLHSTGTYDKKVFYVPTCDRRDRSDYEKDNNLSSMPAIGYYKFDSEDGHILSRKILLK